MMTTTFKITQQVKRAGGYVQQREKNSLKNNSLSPPASPATTAPPAYNLVPQNFKDAFFSPMGLGLLVSVGALMLAKAMEGRGATNKLARARWAGGREKTAARKLACKQLIERKHNRVALYIGTPKGTTFQVVDNKRIINIPEDKTRLYLPDVQRGILVCGGAGSGKTFSMINPLVRSAIDQGLPIVLYDFKYAHQESATADAKGQAPKLRVRVALEPKCTLTTDSCDNDKIFTFFNASFSSIFQALSVFFR
ncbi:hypothetical protein LC605_32520 [Nostoc sp. CHAB 5836]|uniref:type IV secretory system conjugative DNA transfer family protein n=1 Tax=Nostoc sp. CHAB 5836 TaxID=2780404 RepID=UPI001E39B419|nr:hypothetical protein [Nostoc sp. CHAB 5836]MCC5619673.1 hypothetical protein [Nostoc sp. CHAB 5836]